MVEILPGKSETFPFNFVRFRESVSSDPQKTHPLLFELNFFGVSSLLPLLSIRRSKTVDYMSQCTEMNLIIYFTMYGNVLEKTISKVIWVGMGARDAISRQIDNKIRVRFHFQ